MSSRDPHDRRIRRSSLVATSGLILACRSILGTLGRLAVGATTGTLCLPVAGAWLDRFGPSAGWPALFRSQWNNLGTCLDSMVFAVYQHRRYKSFSHKTLHQPPQCPDHSLSGRTEHLISLRSSKYYHRRGKYLSKIQLRCQRPNITDGWWQ